jgi:uncharacterized membrane protein YhhN
MPMSRSKAWATAYWGCAAAHGLSHLIGNRTLKIVTKTALMPTLAAWSRSHRAPRLLVAALLTSAAGDTLMEQQLVRSGMAMYAAAHSCYTILFLRDRTRTSWQTALVYGGLGAAVIAALWPGLGRLRVPVAAYSVMLSSTAVTSSWYARRSAVGGALFLFSDALIATKLAGHDFPTRSPLVGLTYTAAQYNLAAGVVRHQRERAGR